MEQEEQGYEQLRRAVESIAGHEIRENRDFTQLSEEISKHTHFLLSPTTLKRFWGYIDTQQVKGARTTTLDILARHCGYVNYADFCQKGVNKEGVISSEPNFKRTILSSQLKNGQTMRLLWSPGRCVTVRHDTADRFTIMESINSKLQAGDTFRCDSFTEGEPLVLICLEGPGHEAINYGCAKGKGGLTIEL